MNSYFLTYRKQEKKEFWCHLEATLCNETSLCSTVFAILAHNACDNLLAKNAIPLMVAIPIQDACEGGGKSSCFPRTWL